MYILVLTAHSSYVHFKRRFWKLNFCYRLNVIKIFKESRLWKFVISGRQIVSIVQNERKNSGARKYERRKPQKVYSEMQMPFRKAESNIKQMQIRTKHLLFEIEPSPKS